MDFKGDWVSLIQIRYWIFASLYLCDKLHMKLLSYLQLNLLICLKWMLVYEWVRAFLVVMPGFNSCSNSFLPCLPDCQNFHLAMKWTRLEKWSVEKSVLSAGSFFTQLCFTFWLRMQLRKHFHCLQSVCDSSSELLLEEEKRGTGGCSTPVSAATKEIWFIEVLCCGTCC